MIMKWRRFPTSYLAAGTRFTEVDSSVLIYQTTQSHNSEDRSIKPIFFGP